MLKVNKNTFFLCPELDTSQVHDSEQKTFLFLGDFDRSNFQESIEYVLSHDSSLQKEFIDVIFRDISVLEADQQDRVLSEYRQTVQVQTENYWICQFACFQLADQKYRLIWTHHDVEQFPKRKALLFLMKVFDYYKRPSCNAIVRINDTEITNHWKGYLKGIQEASKIPRWPTSSTSAKEYKKYTFTLEEETFQALQKCIETKDLSIRIFIQAAWAFLLWRYHDQDEILLPVTNSFGALLPLRLKVDEEMTFLSLLHVIHHELRKNELIPYIDDLLHFDHLIHVANPKGFSIDFDENLNKAFTLNVYWDRTLKVDIYYAQHRYSFDQVKQIGSHLQNILQQTVRRPECLLKEIEILSMEERDHLLKRLNETTLAIPTNWMTVDQSFSMQARKRPNQIAVSAENGQFTYHELEQKSNQLAALLQMKGIQKGDIVALMTQNSPWMLVGMLGIIKAGAAYLPIDRNYPQKRIEYILEDSQVHILLTETGMDFSVVSPIEVLFIDKIDDRFPSTWNRTHHSTDPVYVIYTSGSTGRPKGVVVEHRALINLISWHCHYYQLTENDRSTKYAGYGFDASVWEVFPYLSAGATIYMIPEEIKYDMNRLHEFIEEHQITCCFLPTPIAEQFMKRDNRSLRVLLTGGDRLRYVQSQSYKVVNNYGPTENTVVTTADLIDPQESIISIGKPIANNKIYILNRFDQLQPIGIPGELCVSGSSLAREYLRKPELTRKSFVNHPFIKGERMYRTGDLARWMPDGRIEYLGRIDQQIQIRGFRVELGEIERCLLQHSSVQEAVVIAKQIQQESSLCAYVVTDLDNPVQTLRSFLEKYLPDYMIPVYWEKLKKVPLTANGKVDERALPEPQLAWAKKSTVPTTETEKKLLLLWQDVLNENHIGIDDHFFHMGGHSLKATMLISRIYHEWGVRISLADFFVFPILKDMARLIDESEARSTETIHPVQQKTFYPASSVQKRLYAIEQTQQVGTTYHIPVIWRVEGTLNIDRLRFTLQTLIQRHEAFRTSFTFDGGDLVQRIHDEIHWKLEEMTVKHEGEVQQCIDSFIQPFDLETGPLFRIGLITLPNHTFVLIWDIHHIISDGVSIGILHREFSLLYQGKVLPELSLQYKDFSVWQQRQLSNHELEKERKYWLKQFSELPSTSELPTDFRRPMSQQFTGEKCCFSIDEELVKACKRLSHEQDVTLYMLFFAVYTILLAKYSDQEFVVVGSVIAGRSIKEWESVFGMFVNTLPIQATPRRELSFTEFLVKIKQQILKAQDHGDYPFAELIEELNLQWDPRRNPLFDTVFVMQNVEIPSVQIPGLKVKTVPYQGRSSMFDMTWEIVEGKSFELWVEYNTSLWKRETIERMVMHFTQILKQVIQSPQEKLAQIQLITEDERTQILSEFNRTQHPLPKGKTVVDLFNEQVRIRPNQIAIVEKGEKITYQRLHEESNQLAHFLRRQGVSKGTIVSILSKNSKELLISIMAVIKAGAAYLPIDPTYPSQRIRYMLQDSRSSILLAPQDQVPSEMEVKKWIDLSRKPWRTESSQDVELIHTDQDLAYVIYTSGSTGKPKGVMVSHRALLNLVNWHNQYYAVNEQDRCTKFAGVSFDASVWEIFPCLAAGATLYIVDPDVRQDIYLLNQFFEKNKITISFLPTAIAESFMQLENHSLRTLLVGGDQLHQVQKRMYQVVNNYGPSENTVVTTSYMVDHPDIQSIPIGRPIFNNQVYIVNQDFQLQPIGVPGELCISGESLAEGYLHQCGLTADRFVPNPFQEGKTMYRTGDLARWLPDGNLEFLGRIDDQVQIRGFRIELGEIETLLLQHEQVKDVVVFAHQDDQNQKVLCAYLLVHEKGLTQELQAYLRKSLPEYMIPTFWFELDTFPMTPNGKIDRKALPSPKKERAFSRNVVKPTSSTQQILVDIWKEVLHVSEVSVDENFFSLGGDSIKAIQVAARLRQYNQKVAVNEIMQYPTIAELAPHVIEEQQNYVEHEPKTGVIPLTPIQQWFFQQKFSSPSHWNQALMVPNEDRWNLGAIRRTFQKLVETHDILRVKYRESNGKIQQIIQEIKGEYFTLDVFSYVHEREVVEVERKIQSQASRLQKSLDLQQGPLIRLAVFETNQKHYLLMIIHHLLIDGVSWRILLEDFWQIYQSVCQNQEVSLPLQTHSFSSWANQLMEYAHSEELFNEISYWRHIEKLKVPLLRKDIQENIDCYLKDSATIEFILSKEQTHQLLHEVHKAYRTEINDLLLTALGCAIKEWSQVDRIAIHLEGHGRESIIEGIDMTRTIGWFTSMYPVVLDIALNELPQLLKSVKEQLRKIPKKGIGYGILRYLTAPESRPQLEFCLEPEISFNYLGRFDQKIHFAGIGSDSKLLGECFSPYTRIHPIEIYGIVVNHQMQFRFLYHRLTYHRETIQNLVERFQAYLSRLIEHCVHQTEVSWTPSDFSASNVSLEELDQFLESLD